jgi:hypothetical protein
VDEGSAGLIGKRAGDVATARWREHAGTGDWSRIAFEGGHEAADSPLLGYALRRYSLRPENRYSRRSILENRVVTYANRVGSGVVVGDARSDAFGIEHFARGTIGAEYSTVKPSSMPSGVEHLVVTYDGPLHDLLMPSSMPSGVEHKPVSSSTMWFGGDAVFDAFRR